MKTVYVDNNATTPVASEVMETMNLYTLPRGFTIRVQLVGEYTALIQP